MAQTAPNRFGTHGRILIADLGTRTSEVETLDEAVYKSFLGGYGLGESPGLQGLARVRRGSFSPVADLLEAGVEAHDPRGEIPRSGSRRRAGDRPGVAIYTATCWGKLVKPRLAPADDRPLNLAPADCYRFVLSHPDVNVCVTAPSTAAQMEANLKALDAGPLDREEMARVRRFASHLRPKPR